MPVSELAVRNKKNEQKALKAGPKVNLQPYSMFPADSFEGRKTARLLGADRDLY